MENTDTGMKVKWIWIAFIFFMGTVSLSNFAPDKTARRIEACMIKDDMQYSTFDGYIPIKEKE